MFFFEYLLSARCEQGALPGLSRRFPARGELAPPGTFGNIWRHFFQYCHHCGGGVLLPASSGQKPGVMLNVLKCTDRRRRPRPSRQRPRRQTPAPSAVRFGPGGVPEGRPAVMRHELTERATAWDTGVRRDTPLDLTSGHTVARTLVERSRLLGLVVGSALSRGWGSYLVGLGQNAERLEAANEPGSEGRQGRRRLRRGRRAGEANGAACLGSSGCAGS